MDSSRHELIFNDFFKNNTGQVSGYMDWKNHWDFLLSGWRHKSDNLAEVTIATDNNHFHGIVINSKI